MKYWLMAGTTFWLNKTKKKKPKQLRNMKLYNETIVGIIIFIEHRSIQSSIKVANE